MEEQKTITSLQNPLVKKVLQLQEKSRIRKKLGLFIIEGQKELELALKRGIELETVLICEDLRDSALQIEKVSHQLIIISKLIYEKLAYRKTTEGIIAIAKVKTHALENLKFQRNNPLVLVAEAPEKPGNIGALLRTADAANLDAVLIANPKSDIYNPNIIRSSVGCVFTQQIGLGSTEEIISFLKDKKLKIYCAALSASDNYINIDYTQATAIVVGTESTGLSDTWLENADKNIIIPMQGEIDSMNVSVSAAILIFEAKRQRGF
ncbi:MULTISPECIES: TrmH family RNA methyltransferase [Croceitalea]|uniref:RNA methyltransferase n=1 Tax=Croceitalea vernalis TaxID=3075599 RepID=A0ABU3BKQ0_9FLAO|nr:MULTISPECIES: RNA methyltransferase [unclassified Croceitalea]MDT0540761.1 RNA methyltransferase [Croceitalea sp. P059]MDT0622740.1 RNA methyltransferase [Croceitalea sp. P007]